MTTFHRLHPRHQQTIRLLQHFTESLGLVTFGTVDQHEDEHKLVRGLTASTTHKDEFYSVGNYEGYDTALVQRADGKTHWLVAELTLDADLPHIVVAPRNLPAYGQLLSAQQALQQVPLGALGVAYSPDFTQRYAIWAQPTNFITAEQLVSPAVALTLAAHFWPLGIEIEGNKLLIYSVDEPVSKELLNKMIRDAVWLAEQLETAPEA